MMPESPAPQYDVRMPQPPRPKRRGPLEFYEWIAFMFFAIILVTTVTISIDSARTESELGLVDSDALVNNLYILTGLLFALLFIFDYTASRRYQKYSEVLLGQWKEDKVRLMKLESKFFDDSTEDEAEEKSDA